MGLVNELSNFAMGTILGKGFPQAQVCAEGMSAMNCMPGIIFPPT